jgi:hypothetical protein
MKRMVVVVAARQTERVREALRAAVGLSLRGDAIEVVLTGAVDQADPQIRRALATIEELGHAVHHGDPSPAIRAAHAVEVWT